MTKRWVRKRNARLNVVKTRGEKRRILLGSHGNRKDKVIRRRAAPLRLRGYEYDPAVALYSLVYIDGIEGF